MSKQTTTRRSVAALRIPAEAQEADYTAEQLALAHMQTFPAAVLVAAAKGEIDIREIVLAELASRGLDPKGAGWIGFPEATKRADAAIAELA